MSGMRPAVKQVIAVLAATIVVVLVAFVLKPWLEGGTGQDSARLNMGGKMSVPGMTGHFSLLASDGRRMTQADFGDRWRLVFFGYTSCPDICPTTLQTVTMALNQLGSKADRLQPLFITVDPERDTSERLAAYLKHFHPALVGLGGSVEDITAAARGFGVYFAKGEVDEASGGYAVDHASSLFLFAPDGEFAAILRTEGDPEKLAETLGDYL